LGVIGLLLVVMAGQPLAAQDVLVSTGSVWKYLDNGSDQGIAWRAVGFDDSGWASGPAELGYGDGDEATVVSFGPSSSNKYVTTYFRHTFPVSNPSAYTTLTLKVLRDDGAVVYLNGTEVFRTNIPDGPITSKTFASSAVGGASEDQFYETPINPGSLVAGANVLAVEVHQSDLTSSDVSFALSLAGTTGQVVVAVRKGPYLIYPGNNTEMMVLWQLDAPLSLTLRWGRDTAYAEGSATPAMYGDNQYKHTITGLTPGAKYYYEVAGVGRGSFLAAPPDDALNVKFLAYGDTRTNPGIHDSVNEAMTDAYAIDPAYQTFTILTGDWVSNGDNESDWTQQFFGRSQSNTMEMQANLSINGCIGNHENSGKGYDKYWPYPYAGAGRYWSFDYGPAHVVVLELLSERNGLGEAQRAWLEADLAASTKEWKILQFHAPVYSAGGHTNNMIEQAYIQSLCETYGVAMVVAGHNHYYAHCDVRGIKHITAGGGGAPLATPDSSYDPSIVKVLSAYHFCKVDIRGLQLDFAAVTPDGAVIDTFTLHHVNDVAAPAPNPITWASAPLATSYDSISMTASTAADDYYGVQYYFECTGGGGHNSNWQTSQTYTDTGLDASTTYTYRVKVRDLSSNRNETGWSVAESATTHPPDVTAPSPDPMAWATAPAASGINSILMSAAIASDSSRVEYYFECTAGGGHNGGWQDGDVYEDTGLAENSPYSYRVKARDKSPNRNETAWSQEVSARTDIDFPYPGDLNRDKLVNFDDLALLGDRWGRGDCSPENFWCSFADLDRSGNVDPCDLLALVSNWREVYVPEEIVMAFDDFESYDNGLRIAQLPGWYCLPSSSRSIAQGIGVGGSAGVTSSSSAFIWSGKDGSINEIRWPELAVGDAVVIGMDFEFSGASFQNDVVGWWNNPSYGFFGPPGAPGAPPGPQSGHFGVRLDRVGRSPSGFGILGYWDNASRTAARPLIANIDSLDAGAWYRLRAVFTKLTDFSTRIDAELWLLDSNGGPVSLAAEGSVEDTSLLAANAPSDQYFTNVWPAFMNEGAPAACDNAYYGLILIDP